MTGRLLHYRSEPLEFEPARTYVHRESWTYGKPDGFWVSVEGQDDWPAWCRSEGRLGCDRNAVDHGGGSGGFSGGVSSAVSIPSPCGGAGVMGFVFTSSLPSQSLQRRARSRQVDVSAPRPVGTTTPGGAS